METSTHIIVPITTHLSKGSMGELLDSIWSSKFTLNGEHKFRCINAKLNPVQLCSTGCLKTDFVPELTPAEIQPFTEMLNAFLENAGCQVQVIIIAGSTSNPC